MAEMTTVRIGMNGYRHLEGLLFVEEGVLYFRIREWDPDKRSRFRSEHPSREEQITEAELHDDRETIRLSIIRTILMSVSYGSITVDYLSVAITGIPGVNQRVPEFVELFEKVLS